MTGDAEDPFELGPSDDLEDVETSMSRFGVWARGLIAVVLVVGMLVPAGAWLLDEIRFRTAGDEVLETVEGELAGAEAAEALLLVRTVGCVAGTGGSGSAFVVDTGAGSVLVTNRHVVEGARHVAVRRLDDDAAIAVTEARVSETADVAVLEVADPGELPPALSLRRGSVTIGERVRLIGFPGAVPFTDDGEVRDVSATRMTLDLQVGRGASGSPVIDDDGRVVGQVFAITDERLGLATPVDEILRALGDTRPLGPC